MNNLLIQLSTWNIRRRETIVPVQWITAKTVFGKPPFVIVSGQLGEETHSCALGDIYTFGPTFRADNSQTTRHIAEFHMVVPEIGVRGLASCDGEC